MGRLKGPVGSKLWRAGEGIRGNRSSMMRHSIASRGLNIIKSCHGRVAGLLGAVVIASRGGRSAR